MILAALFAFAASPPPQSAPPVKDALLGPLLNDNGPDPRELHARVRSGLRDPAVETVVLSRYRALPDLKNATTLRVICGSNLCEIAANVPSGHSLVAIQRLGLGGFKDAGFTSTYFEVGAGKNRPTFVTYLKRVEPAR